MAHQDVLEGASKGFTSADLYDRARPSYRDDVVTYFVDTLHLNKDSVIVDLAAGTGKMTEVLLKFPALKGAKIIAVEPVPEMRKKLTDNLGSNSNLQVLDGTAAKIPLDSGSVDAVVVAQAFHWFDNEEAVTEMARVLKPGKSICLVWNMEDDTAEWVAQLRTIYEEHDKDVPQYRKGQWKNVFEADKKKASTLFSHPISSKKFSWQLENQTPHNVWERIASKSYIVRLDDAKRLELKTKVMELLLKYNTSFAGLKSSSAADLINSNTTTTYPYFTEVVIVKKA